MDHSKVSFSSKTFVRGLSAVARGCPRLSEPLWCMSAVVRDMAGFLAFLLSADVREGILNIKPYHFWGLLVRGCPRPPWSPTSCGKAVVRGLYGFFVGFGLFLVCQSNVICASFRGYFVAALLVFVCYRDVPIPPWLTPSWFVSTARWSLVLLTVVSMAVTFGAKTVSRRCARFEGIWTAQTWRISHRRSSVTSSASLRRKSNPPAMAAYHGPQSGHPCSRPWPTGPWVATAVTSKERNFLWRSG